MSFLVYIGLFLSFVFSFYFLIISRKHIKADKYLGGLYVLFFVLFLFNAFSVAGFLEKNPQFLLWEIGIPFLLGPMIWFYVESLTPIPNEVSFNKLFHFIPVLIIYLAYFDIFLLSPEEKMSLIKEPSNQLGIRFQVFTIMELLPVPIYLIFSLIRLKKYQKNLKKVFSSVEELNHKWLSYLLFVFLVFWSILSFGMIFLNFIELSKTIAFANLISFIAFMLMSGVYGIVRNNTIRKIQDVKEEIVIEEEKDKDDEKETEEYKFVEDFISKNKPFLSADINIGNLAREMGIPVVKLSKILNNHYNRSFFDYINEKRVEEFKQKVFIPEHKNKSIVEIAFCCGFNSKSAFYRYFKKYEGTSPGEFIKKIKVD